MLAIRNNEPLTNREQYGYTGVNDSPLGTLFRTFRRNSPQKSSRQTYQDILFIKDNELAKRWAREYRKGVGQYRDDTIWREELIKSDLDASGAPPAEASPSTGTGDTDFLLGQIEQENGTGLDTDSQHSQDTGEQGLATLQVANPTVYSSDQATMTQRDNNTQAGTTREEEKVQRTLISDLCLHITGIGISGKSYDVEVYAIAPNTGLIAKPAWFGRLTERNVYEIEVNLQHPAFNSTSLQVRDAVLAQIAYLITFEETAISGAKNEVNYGDILVALRNRYAITDSLDVNHLRMEVDELRKRITKCLSKSLPEERQREVLKELPFEDVQRIELAYARGPKSSSLITYLEMTHLARLLQQQPDIFFDAGCFNQPWTPPTLANNIVLLDEHRRRLLRELWMPLIEMGEFMNDLTSSHERTKSYVALIRACINRVRDYLMDESSYV